MIWYVLIILAVFLAGAYAQAAWEFVAVWWRGRREPVSPPVGPHAQALRVVGRNRSAEDALATGHEHLVGPRYTVNRSGTGWVARDQGKEFAISEGGTCWYYMHGDPDRLPLDLEIELSNLVGAARTRHRVMHKGLPR